VEDQKILEDFCFELLWKLVKQLLLIQIQILFFEEGFDLFYLVCLHIKVFVRLCNQFWSSF